MPRTQHILVNLLAIVLISFLGVDIFYRLVRIQLWPEQTQSAPAVRHQVIEQAGRRAGPGYEALLKRNLFGGGASPGKGLAVLSQMEITSLAPTSLQLRLLGTIVGDEASGRAIIEDLKLKNQDLYRVGDEIQGARLKTVLRGKVVLETGGRDEILVMTEKQAETKPAAKPATGSKGKPSAGAGRPKAPASGRPEAVSARTEVAGLGRDAGATRALDHEEIQTALDNLGDILAQVRVQPYQEEGNFRGLQVSEISPDSIFSRMGLRDGDVVEAVNDKQIEGPDDIIALYQNLKVGSRLNLRISRGGQQQALNYTIR